MTPRTIRLLAFASLASFAVLLVLASMFHERISEVQAAVYILLGMLALATLATAYFLPRAVGTLLRRRRQRRR